MQNATHVNTPSQTEHSMRWSAKIVSPCTTDCAVVVNMNAAIAGFAMDDWLHKKLKLCKILQDSAKSATLACRCKRVRFKYWGEITVATILQSCKSYVCAKWHRAVISDKSLLGSYIQGFSIVKDSSCFRFTLRFYTTLHN